MTSSEALIYIIRDARVERCSKTSYQRVCKALATLGVAGKDADAVLKYLDYHHPDTNRPYERFVK